MIPEKKRILLADDSEEVRLLFKDILEKAGFEVELACDGSEALEIFNKQKPDLLITDIAMPKLNGIQLLKIVRGCAPEFPVFIHSGSTMEFQDQGELSAATEVIEKFSESPSDFVKRVLKTLPGKS